MTRSRRQNRAPSGKTANQLRIIGGQWRGRKLHFPDAPGLRPTPDRVRETLFNWLAPVIPGARCLDLFAGSGALSMEALSRGAGSATLVDSSTKVAQQLRANLQLLQANGEVVCQCAEAWLASALPANYDVVFLDPPFDRGFLQKTLELIIERNILAPNSWVYIETGASEALPGLPASWHLHREKQAGQVCYRLLHYQQHGE